MVLHIIVFGSPCLLSADSLHPTKNICGLERSWGRDKSDEPTARGARPSRTAALSRSLAGSLRGPGICQTVLLAGAGLAPLQTMRVAGLATQIADGLVEAVRQHGQLAAVTQGAGGAARAATMLAPAGLLETEETH